MFGKNKILKPENHDGLHLDVVEIFPTLQGEGPYVGYPSVFVRLGGCNLACEFCDTEFENYKNFSLSEILDEVRKLAKNDEGKIVRNLVVITGGEPLRQPIELFCEELVKSGFLVQIETNGTLFRELPKEVKIICSPKISNGKYHSIRPDLLARINAFKFIVRNPHSCHLEHSERSLPISRDSSLTIAKSDCKAHDDGGGDKENYSEIMEVGQSKFKTPVYVQPMDEYDEVKNKKNLQYAADLCQKHGYLLSIQLHKMLGLK
ncbi:MAG: 7-carboxy-7-deazaguanine synthase QueE [Rickettsiales bacterium]|nr:7-carboxy-7-deazaguanine synthase QueE [Rickettsiales bacterium]